MRAVGRRRTKDLHLPPRMRKKGHAYYYDTGGKPRRYIPLGSDLAAARIQWAELSNTGEGRTVQHMIDWFFATHVPTLAENTRRNYENFRTPLERCFGHMAISAVRPEHIATYLDDHASASGANGQIGMLGTMYERAQRRGWTDSNPCRGIKRNTLKRRDRYLTDAEYHAIRAQAGPALRAAMEIGYITGLRPGDICKIRRDDLKPEGLYIQQQKTGRRQLYSTTPELTAALAAARAVHNIDSVFLLCDHRGQPYTTMRLSRAFLTAARSADVKRAQLRDIRAKAATDAKELGQDYQAILGHTTRAMSDSYIKPKAILKVEPLRKKL